MQPEKVESAWGLEPAFSKGHGKSADTQVLPVNQLPLVTVVLSRLGRGLYFIDKAFALEPVVSTNHRLLCSPVECHILFSFFFTSELFLCSNTCIGIVVMLLTWLMFSNYI